MKNKKILFVLPNFHLGGAERWIFYLAKRFHNLNYETTILLLTSSGFNKFLDYGGKIVILKNNPFFLFNNKFRMVFATNVKINGALGLLRSLKILKTNKLILRESTLIFRRFSYFKTFIYKFFYFIGYRSADEIICQSELMKTDLTKNIFLLNKNLMRVLINPLDLERVKYLSLKDEIIPTHEYVLAVGRLIDEKGFDLLIKCYSLIDGEKPNLIILGEGPERKKLENIIAQNNLNKKVLLMGHHPNPYPIMKNAVGCIISSRIEGFPNVLNEMIYLNNNVLSSLCVPEIKNLEFILTEDINNIQKYKKALMNLFCKKKLIGKTERNEYLKKIDLRTYVEKNILKN